MSRRLEELKGQVKQGRRAKNGAENTKEKEKVVVVGLVMVVLVVVVN